MPWQIYAKDLKGEVHPEHWTNDPEVVERVMQQLDDDPLVAEAWYREEK